MIKTELKAEKNERNRIKTEYYQDKTASAV